MSSPFVNLHVERTGVPEVLRWVCHLETVPDGARLPPDGSALRTLIEDGVIDIVSARDGDLSVRFVRPPTIDGAAVAVVHRAVVAALADTAWLERPTSTGVHIRTR